MAARKPPDPGSHAPFLRLLGVAPLAFMGTRRITPMRLRSSRHGHEGIIADIVVTRQEATSDEGEGDAKGGERRGLAPSLAIQGRTGMRPIVHMQLNGWSDVALSRRAS